MHRTELEWLADDATTCLEDGSVHVEPIEFSAAIDEVVDSGCQATYRYVIRSRANHGGIVSLGKLRQPVGCHRAGNDDEAHIAEALNIARRQLAARINYLKPVVHTRGCPAPNYQTYITVGLIIVWLAALSFTTNQVPNHADRLLALCCPSAEPLVEETASGVSCSLSPSLQSRRTMTKLAFLATLLGILVGTTASAQQSLDTMLDREIAQLVSTYKMLHAAPELSHHEEKTAVFVAAQLRALGFTVTERVGKYAQPELTSYGVVAVMKNGAGPTVLVRTELDALPVEEKTGLPYASTVKAKDDAGQEVSVMHACGHDIHMTNFLGTAKMLVALKDQWHGTLVMIGQPAEETVNGARAMLADGW